MIRDAGAVAKFEAHFERMSDAAQPMVEVRTGHRGAEGRSDGAFEEFGGPDLALSGGPMRPAYLVNFLNWEWEIPVISDS